jgi:hypothetical protein
LGGGVGGGVFPPPPPPLFCHSTGSTSGFILLFLRLHSFIVAMVHLPLHHDLG